jgi:hypothetical protein
MSRTFWVIVALLVAASSGMAQTGEKVLIMGTNSLRNSAMSGQLSQYFKGQIDVSSSLPLSLQDYRAIFITSAPETGISFKDQVQLTTYIENRGCLLTEWLHRHGQAGDATDPLWNRVGDSGFVGLATDVTIDTIKGIGGTFAEGMSIPNPDFRFADPTLELMYYPGMQEVVDNLDWISQDTSIRFVAHMPQWRHQRYYEQIFLGYVACNYFNLCVLDVPERSVEVRSILYDPTRAELTLPSTGRIEVSDILGRVLVIEDLKSVRYRLPRSLAKGSYVVRWQLDAARASTTISVF